MTLPFGVIYHRWIKDRLQLLQSGGASAFASVHLSSAAGPTEWQQLPDIYRAPFVQIHAGTIDQETDAVASGRLHQQREYKDTLLVVTHGTLDVVEERTQVLADIVYQDVRTWLFGILSIPPASGGEKAQVFTSGQIRFAVFPPNDGIYLSAAYIPLRVQTRTD